MAKMNSTSLYTTTNQIILKADPSNPTTWQDLYRLVPYLRNSLCCVVCANLLVEPHSPASGRCQHHLCKKCKGGRKKIKPACSWCKDCKDYNENKNLRILLQCYKQMCTYLLSSNIFKGLVEQASKTPPASGVERGAGNLILLIKEGTEFEDNYKSEGGIPRSAYNILPCIYTNSSTQTLQFTPVAKQENVPQTNNRPSLYSVVIAGSANKITIKRKPKEEFPAPPPVKALPVKRAESLEKTVFKKPTPKCSVKPKKGCRCGNATATPGKLTCCGQRCPCYVESKACVDCKCRGCRNPHRLDGLKVRPHLPEVQMQYELPQSQVFEQVLQPNIKLANVKMDSQYGSYDPLSYKTYKVVTSNFNGLALSTNILLNSPLLEEDDGEITVDV